MHAQPDTIYALATPPGTSGVAVIRVSGAQAASALRSLQAPLPAARVASLVSLMLPSGRLLDRTLALHFPAPHSFTGEDVVELHIHGSRAIRDALFAHFATLPGLRMAEAGEFTRRAFLNGKMDILEAEGLADVIHASTAKQLEQAWRQASGVTSQTITKLRDEIMRPLALLEAYIDFPDEEIPEQVLEEIKTLHEVLTSKLKSLLAMPPIGEKLRDGLEVIILGPPNAGKSSLINRLTSRELAIVTAEAGTTRDLLEAQLDLCGFPLTLIDSAGLRDTDQMVEKIGIENTQKRAKTVDMAIMLLENDTIAEQYLKNLDLSDEKIIFCQNKCDRDDFTPRATPAIAISALTGMGIDQLCEAMVEKAEALSAANTAPVITRQRHRAWIESALQELMHIRNDQPLELICEHYRRAATCIGNITGKIYQDNLLDIIFRDFCIGK
jgi:tRNA modification GTPase